MASKAETDRREPVNEQVVANMYASMRTELNQIYSKITELEMEASEHSLVINAIQPLDQSRRCYRMIGGVLVERTIKEVLPAVQRNKEGIEEVISRLNEALEKKKKEITEFEAKYKIRIRKPENEVKDDGNRKEGSAQGVLVGPAGSTKEILNTSSCEKPIRQLSQNGIHREQNDTRPSNDSQYDTCRPQNLTKSWPFDLPYLLSNTTQEISLFLLLSLFQNLLYL